MVNPQHTTPQASADLFCSVLSLEAGEPLFGTAVHNDIWLLLEYDGPWGEKATTDNDLPVEVQAWLESQAAATMGHGRVQFIKQERERPRNYLTFYVAQAREIEPRMFRFQLADYTDLLKIDMAALLAGDGAYDEQRQFEPLYLVCTNGRRDRCCALFGLEVYYSLQHVARDEVWQTTHVGGHRFAANVLTFPDGTYYGRVHTGNAARFYEARQRGEVALPYLRGRSCYEEVVQAADYFLRQETGQPALQAFVFEALEKPQAEQYEASFLAQEGDARYVVSLQRETVEMSLFASCGKPGEEPCTVYRLLSVKK